MRFIRGDRLTNILRRPKEQNIQKLESDTSHGQLGLRAEPYSVRCIKTYEPVSVCAVSVCAQRPRTREVTLVQMAFANCDIWIALPGDGVAFVEVN
jgi:hypothetical protein